MPTPDTFEEKKIKEFRNKFCILIGTAGAPFSDYELSGHSLEETLNIIAWLRTTIAEAREQQRERFKKHLQIMIDKNVDMDFKTLDYKGLSNDILQYKNEDLTLP